MLSPDNLLLVLLLVEMEGWNRTLLTDEDDDGACSWTNDGEEEDDVSTSTSYSYIARGERNKTPTIIQTCDIHILKGEGIPKQHYTKSSPRQ